MTTEHITLAYSLVSFLYLAFACVLLGYRLGIRTARRLRDEASELRKLAAEDLDAASGEREVMRKYRDEGRELVRRSVEATRLLDVHD